MWQYCPSRLRGHILCPPSTNSHKSAVMTSKYKHLFLVLFAGGPVGVGGRSLLHCQLWGIHMAVGHGFKLWARIRRTGVSLKAEERKLAQEWCSLGKGPGTQCPRRQLLWAFQNWWGARKKRSEQSSKSESVKQVGVRVQRQYKAHSVQKVRSPVSKLAPESHKHWEQRAKWKNENSSL